MKSSEWESKYDSTSVIISVGRDLLLVRNQLLNHCRVRKLLEFSLRSMKIGIEEDISNLDFFFPLFISLQDRGF